MTDRVLVIGTGGSEQSLCWSMAQSHRVKQVLFAPGNDDTYSGGKVTNSAVLTNNPSIVKQFCKDHNISLVVISPLTLLTAGLVDDLSGSGVKCFGPTAKTALLQYNKSDAKDFMQRHGIPTARWKSFTDPHEACHFITYAEFPALVVKRCAFGSGKGPYIARDKDEACRAVQHLTQDWTLGGSSLPIIVEELLEGEEFYCLCIIDGTTLTPMPYVHIEKQLEISDQAQQNASSRKIEMSEKSFTKIQGNILWTAIDGLRKEGWAYTGIFGAKVMMTPQGPMVLGFRCTFQDLDTSIISPLLKPDLYEMMQAAMEDKLSSYVVGWSQETRLYGASSWPKEIKRDHCSKDARHHRKIQADKSTDETDMFSSTKTSSVVEFPGTVYRKDEDFPGYVHKDKDRSTAIAGQDNLTRAESVCYPAEPGFKVTGIHRRGHIRTFEVDTAQYKDPVFLCTTNGIGDLIKVAQACSLHKAATKNLVSVCTNDLMSHGAQTLYFMPFLTHFKLPLDVSTVIQEGLSEACDQNGCSLLDREFLEQSTVHHGGSYSLFGCAVGVVEREHQLPRMDQMRDGDMVIVVRSLGLQCNNLGMLRKILEKHSLQYTSTLPMSDGTATWGEMVMSSAPFYSKSLFQTLRSSYIRAYIPISEGGLVGSILQYLPKSIGLVLDALCWKVPVLYSWLYKEGGLSEQDLVENFGCGLGAVIITQRNMAQQILAEIQQEEEAWIVGGLLQLSSGSSRVWVCHLLEAMKVNAYPSLRIDVLKKAQKVVKAAVFISSSGMKLKILIDTFRQLGGCSKLALVVSSKSLIEELRKAVAAGVPTRVIDHTLFSCHSDFEHTIDQVLDEFSIDLICLAGFGRTLSKQFLTKWKGKLLKVSSPQKEDGSPRRIHGCTVTFLLDGPSPEPIVLQETIATGSDTELSEQIEEAKSKAVAKALHLVASNVVSLGVDGNTSWRPGD